MSEEGNISYKPTDGLCYDASEELYWDKEALDKEVTRAFEICHGCRMCFKYCDAFPRLFGLLDAQGGEHSDVRKLTEADTAAIMGDCFQCKLCEVQCPYTPRDDHEFQLDFPKLVHRYNAQKHKREGSKLQDKLLGDPDGSAKMARASFGLVNIANRVRIHRVFFEKIAGVHRDKKLPLFVSETFEKWAVKNDKIKPPAEDNELVLFQTCFVQNNEPDIGKDALFVLEKNQVKVACEKGLNCCGMPAWEHGDLDALRRQAKNNLDRLLPHVEKGAKVAALNPTCGMMMKQEYVELLDGEDKERAKVLAEAVMDPSEYLWSIRKEERFSTDFKTKPGKVAYHAPCHLRAQRVGFKGRDLMRKIPDASPAFVLECCGHDGTYGMKVDSFEASARIGEKSFEDLKKAEADVWVTDCPLAATQFEQHAGKKALHPLSVLARAYREDGFAQRVEPSAEKEEEK